MCILPHTCRKSPERACIEIAIKKFKNHARIMNMNKNIPKTTTSSYHEMETDSLKKMINNLNSRKSGTFGGIQANCLEGTWDISTKFLHTVWNDEVKDLKFFSELKLADVVPAFKKEDSTLVENYRPFVNHHQDFEYVLNNEMHSLMFY